MMSLAHSSSIASRSPPLTTSSTKRRTTAMFASALTALCLEAILLEQLDGLWRTWTADLPALLTAGIDQDAPVGLRGDQFAAVLTASVADRRVLCDLLSSQAGVLEHNVSAQVAARYKRAAVDHVIDLAALARHHVPELEDRAGQLAAAVIMSIGAVWTHARPSEAMLAAYRADPSLAAYKMDFAAGLQDMLTTLTAGAVARALGTEPVTER
ncbi:TetR/AcrR family transcriptional regulator [Streptomyces sp. ZAF1911]|uniref:TetR/AcrR family transcriptional regulator n=1 Tax=Streptomyces sp. ZAF1911 TaxID=2944129 RepID=UPI003FD6457C